MNGFQIARNFVVNDPQLTFNMSTELTKMDGYRGVATTECTDRDHDDHRAEVPSSKGHRRQRINGIEVQTGGDIRRSSLWKYSIPIIILFFCLVIFLIYAMDPGRCRFISYRKPLLPLADPAPPPFTEESRRNRSFVLALMGDSMVIDPEWQHFGLQSGIQQHLPNYRINFTNLGRNGARVAHARNDIDAHIFNRSSPSSVKHHHKFPDGIILSCDRYELANERTN